MSSDRESSSGGAAAFERCLIESARDDGPARDAAAAWAQFAGALSVVAVRGATARDPGGDAGSRFSRPSDAASMEPATRVAVATASGLRSPAALALKWVVLGAIGGGALAAAIRLDRQAPTRLDARVRAVDGAIVALSIPGGASRRASGHPAAASVDDPPRAREGSGARLERPRQGPRTGHHRRGKAHATSRLAEASAIDAAPGLAAEVARIDAARRALAAGDLDEAIGGIARYHRDFPDGALAPDADVVALEAVAASGDSTEVARRVAAFLARYPDDPHAARVRALAAGR